MVMMMIMMMMVKGLECDMWVRKRQWDQSWTRMGRLVGRGASAYHLVYKAQALRPPSIQQTCQYHHYNMNTNLSHPS